MPATSKQEHSAPRLGLKVDRRTTPPGVVELEAVPDHRVKIHAGPPVRGACSVHRFLYSRGEIDIWPAGRADVWREESANTSIFVHLPVILLRRAAEEMGIDPTRAGLESRHQFRDAQIEHIGWALDAEREAGFPSGLLYTESLGMALAVHLLRAHGKTVKIPRGLSKPQLRRLIEYIEEHLDQNLTLTRLGDIADVSASHLKTLFRQSMGVPVHAYVIQRRVERAKNMLLTSELPASQIALAAGFSHQSHMARCMRRVLGVTPTSIRARGDQSPQSSTRMSSSVTEYAPPSGGIEMLSIPQ